MTLDMVLKRIEDYRKERGVDFNVDPETGAIGTADSAFRSPLGFLHDCLTDSSHEGEPSPGACADVLDVPEELAHQITLVSDGGWTCYLRTRLASACGLSS